jgi:hypothetical protein
MAANTSPIFTLAPRFSAVRITAANTSSQGGGTIGTDIFLAFSPGTNGSYLQRIRFSLTESTISTTSAASVHRVFLSTVNSGTTTNANTFLIQEINAAAQTPTSTVSSYPIDIPLNFAIPSSYYVLISTHVAPTASTNWNANVFGGDY